MLKLLSCCHWLSSVITLALAALNVEAVELLSLASLNVEAVELLSLAVVCYCSRPRQVAL